MLLAATTEAAIFLGLTAEGWIATGTFVLAAATVVLVAVGLFQISSAREETKKTRTLEACDRYDRDAVLYNCLRRLAFAKTSGALAAEPTKFRPEVSTLLNYLDSLAVGIAQGLYIEELARDHVEPILKRHVDQFLGPDAPNVGLDRANYACLTELRAKWSNSTPRFQDGQSRWKRRKKQQ
ncbi:MAG TPA: hypothetical protein VGV41_12410 [Pseudolabrys sp.]|uniref:DUF4760 domain-containing protein n=1 Tax=Pseudolabrys sp. TaxID=1960880 RepID=UPI002DDD715A|nr:hypothetical protein [Pseudolabrys sp.]HEV2629434.1 hypothetical protein [Pseudolabrys sp.]